MCAIVESTFLFQELPELELSRCRYYGTSEMRRGEARTAENVSFFKLAGEADSLLRARMDMAEGQIARVQQPRRARPLARRNQPFSSRFCRCSRWPVEAITRTFCAMASEN